MKIGNHNKDDPILSSQTSAKNQHSSKSTYINTGKNFKTMFTKIEREIIQFCEQLGARSFTLGFINIDNLPLVEQMHNKKIESLIEKKLSIIFSDAVNNKYILKRIAFDTYLFLIIMQPEDDIQHFIEDLIFILNNDYIFHNDYHIYFSVKVGYTDYEGGQNFEGACNQAMTALAECRSEAGITHSSYSNSLVKIQRHINKMELASHFQKAINAKKIRLGYQPIVNSLTKKVSSYECLLRVETDEGKFISAGPFISISENFGFVHQVDTLVLKIVAEKLEEDRNIKLSLNLSKSSIDNIHWLKLAKKLLYNKNLASRLTIEITETALHKDLRKVAHFVKSLQNLGCRVSIDDFGSGYTSFAQLKLLKVDEIKIDGVFIRDIIDNENSKLFISTLVSFARSLGLKTIAEYVENEEIANALIDLKVDYLQGDYFGMAKVKL